MIDTIIDILHGGATDLAKVQKQDGSRWLSYPNGNGSSYSIGHQIPFRSVGR
jgi:hypothetical protein